MTHSRDWQLSSGAMLFEGRRFFAASLLKKPEKARDFLTATTVKFCENMLQPYLKFSLVVVVDM